MQLHESSNIPHPSGNPDNLRPCAGKRAAVKRGVTNLLQEMYLQYLHVGQTGRASFQRQWETYRFRYRVMKAICYQQAH